MPLTADRISHSYGGGKQILDDVSLEVADGESVALMGPSGSGKTTLLSIMGLLLRPSTGRVLIDATAVPETGSRREAIRSAAVGWIFQTTNALGRRTTLENAALGLLAAGRSLTDAESSARRALNDVGLAEVADMPARSLSGGELQRMCVARALTSEPRFILADEPTGQLDRATSVVVLDALWAVASDRGVGIVVATHDTLVAERCGRVVTIVDGRLA